MHYINFFDLHLSLNEDTLETYHSWQKHLILMQIGNSFKNHDCSPSGAMAPIFPVWKEGRKHLMSHESQCKTLSGLSLVLPYDQRDLPGSWKNSQFQNSFKSWGWLSGLKGPSPLESILNACVCASALEQMIGNSPAVKSFLIVWSWDFSWLWQTQCFAQSLVLHC